MSPSLPRRHLLAIAATLLACHAIPSATRLPRLFLAGDSTVSDYPFWDWPEAGWGQGLRQALRGRAEVLNRAVPGMGTRRFLREVGSALWSDLAPGDALLVQFGHIDALPDTPRHASLTDYQAALAHIVQMARAQGAQPVLVTPVAMCRFARGRVIRTLAPYAQAMLQVAQTLGVPWIDLAEMSAQRMEQIGEAAARSWFMVAHDGHDTIHLSRAGALAMGAMVEDALVRLGVVRALA